MAFNWQIMAWPLNLVSKCLRRKKRVNPEIKIKTANEPVGRMRGTALRSSRTEGERLTTPSSHPCDADQVRKPSLCSE